MCGKMVLSKKGMNTMRRTYLALSDEDRDYFITLSKKRTIQAQIVDLLLELQQKECMSLILIVPNFII